MAVLARMPAINQARDRSGNELHAAQGEHAEDDRPKGLAYRHGEIRSNTQRGDEARQRQNRGDQVVRIIQEATC